MQAPAPPAHRAFSSNLALVTRVALRNLRGGLAGFGIFLACIALGVAAIVGVGSVSHGLSDGLARESGRILGGDVAFALIHVELDPAERSWLAARGSISSIATMAAMARRDDGNSALVDIKAVDASYPSVGEIVLDPNEAIAAALAPKAGVYGLVADDTLAARLDVKPGDHIAIGGTTFEFRGTIITEPDKLAGGIGFGPRVIVSQDALRATGLLQPGSLVRWIYRLALPPTAADHPPSDAAVGALVDDAAKAFPEAGWQVRTRSNVSPQFAKGLDQFAQFLTLVGLTALIVGGVGVGNAVRAFVDRKRADLATMKALGATGSMVFAATLTQVMIVACIGIAIGLVAGAALPFVIAGLFGSIIPFPYTLAIYPGELAAGALYGLLTALAFSLGPLARTHDVPVSALFRDAVDPPATWPRPRYIVMMALAGAALLAAILWLATDRELAAIYIGATLIGFALLRLVGLAIMFLARRMPHARTTELRLAIANLHRPGALTPSVVLSLGLGLALLVALTMIDGNVRGAIDRSTAGATPSFFFLDIQGADLPAFDRFIASHAPDGVLNEVPMMRGRLTALNGTPADQIHAAEDSAWVLDGDRGITYSTNVPDGSVVTEGDWWPDNYSGPPLVSMEGPLAKGLGLKLGDSITVNVFGRSVTAKIANFRKVNWRSLGINFVFVFSPNTFAGSPATHLATLTYVKAAAPGDASRDIRLLRDAAQAFPAVTTMRVKDALDALNDVMNELAFAIRGASGVALSASILVLAGALAAGQQARIYDAVVLKTLGATRRRLLVALILEYALLGLTTAIFGILAGAVSAYFIVTRVMKLDDFDWLWSTAAIAAALALVVTVGLGLLGTWRVLGQRPAPYLRNL